MGFDVVLWDATTGGVHQPEVELRAGVTLLGGAAEPGDRLDVILWDAFTGGVRGLARWYGGAGRKAPSPSCRKRPFTTHAGAP